MHKIGLLARGKRTVVTQGHALGRWCKLPEVEDEVQSQLFCQASVTRLSKAEDERTRLIKD